MRGILTSLVVLMGVLVWHSEALAQINWNLARPPAPVFIAPPPPTMADQAIQGYAAGLAMRQQREQMEREARAEAAALSRDELSRRVGAIVAGGDCAGGEKYAVMHGDFELAGSVRAYCAKAEPAE